MIINKDFKPKREGNSKLPPGQYEVKDFPVLSLGPTPHVSKEDWLLEVFGLLEKPTKWNWNEFNSLPKVTMKKDIHCVTKWSKLGTKWEGVSMDEIIKIVGVKKGTTHLIAHSYDGYSTNLPLEDVSNGKAMVATSYEGEEIPSEHGGPARLFVPHLYFWKSAKWLKGLEFVSHDIPGFWETRGYHNYGDPWKEQRYSFD
ncbi:MAG TPA: sulfite oxidase-like oxidoreductase [Candidatus Paceibacterota bacterium]